MFERAWECGEKGARETEHNSQTENSRKTKGKKKERAANEILGEETRTKERARDVCGKCIFNILFEM